MSSHPLPEHDDYDRKGSGFRSALAALPVMPADEADTGGPLVNGFYRHFLRQGHPPEKARQMAKLAGERPVPLSEPAQKGGRR